MEHTWQNMRILDDCQHQHRHRHANINYVGAATVCAKGNHFHRVLATNLPVATECASIAPKMHAMQVLPHRHRERRKTTRKEESKNAHTHIFFVFCRPAKEESCVSRSRRT